jgi:hypothetical protein
MSRTPNLFIIGYPKCGTSSLFTYLAEHPDFCGSSKKEPTHFFDHRFDTTKYDLAAYSQYFSHCGQQRFVFEASVTHARGGRAHAQFLKDTFDNPKAIVMLREPVSRLYSYYNLCRDNGYIPATMTFEGFLEEGERRRAASGSLPEGVWRSYATRYEHHLFEWMDVFGDDLYIGFFDHLKAASAAFCDDVCAWLGVEPLSRFTVEYPVENRTIAPRSFRLHRMARSVNRVAEPVLRRNQVLRRGLRELYQLTNARQHGPQGPTPDQRRRLEALFAPSNALLRAELRRRRPALVLPPWLERAPA